MEKLPLWVRLLLFISATGAFTVTLLSVNRLLDRLLEQDSRTRTDTGEQRP